MGWNTGFSPVTDLNKGCSLLTVLKLNVWRGVCSVFLCSVFLCSCGGQKQRNIQSGVELTAARAAGNTAQHCSAGRTGVSGGQAWRPVLSEEQAQARVTVTVTMIGASPVTKSASIGGNAVGLENPMVDPFA